MRKLVTSTFLTLDGVMQAPGGSKEDYENGFEYGGWSAPLWDEAISDFMGELMGKPFDLLLGRKTYDLFAGFWPNQPDEAGGKSLNDATKYVASRGKPDLTWDKSVHLQGDLVEAVQALKQSGGPELQVHGSADMLQTLLAANLIDEMRLIIYPVVIGSGKRLFGTGAVPTSMKALSSKVAANGTVMAVYQPSPGIETADIA